MFLLRNKSLVLERHQTELWLTPLWKGSWSVKSPRLRTFNPYKGNCWSWWCCLMYIQRRPKPGLSHWQTNNSAKDHRVTGVRTLASFPSSGTCSQTAQGSDLHLMSPALAAGSLPLGPPGEPMLCLFYIKKFLMSWGQNKRCLPREQKLQTSRSTDFQLEIK